MIEEYLKQTVQMLQDHRYQVNGYVCTHDYILKKGHKFESATLTDEEMAFALTYRSTCKTKECYFNAQRVLVNSHPNLRIGYVEGVALSRIIPVEHAWNTINGKLVDLTWGPMCRVNKRDGSWYLRRTSRVLGVIPEGFEYYGVELDHEVVTSNMLAHRLFTSVIDDYMCEYPLLRGVEGHKK